MSRLIDCRRRRHARAMVAAAISAATAAAGPVTAAAAAPPNVTFDLRVNGTGGKEATVSTVGDLVNLDLYAIVTGLDADLENESMNLAAGNFRSSNGGLKGNLLGLFPPSPFNNGGSTIGTQRDLDGDGDLDVGTDAFEMAFDAYVFRAGSLQENPPGGQRVGRVRFTVTDVTDSTTEVSYHPRTQNFIQAWIDGVIGNYADGRFTFASGAPVVIRGVPGDPGGVQYIDGVIATHQTISANTAVTPGKTLQFTTGFDVTPAGTLTAHAASATINDATSGNAGGTLLFGEMHIGTSAGGTFTHSGGYSKFAGVTAGASSVPGTLVVTGGSFEAGPVTIGNNGLLRQNGGTATLGSLSVSGDMEMVSGSMAVTGNTMIGAGGVVTISMGSIDFNSALGMAPGSLLRIQGGTLNVVFTTGLNGRIEQSGGEFHSTLLTAVPGGYSITGGTYTGSSFLVAEGTQFVQEGGNIAAATGVFVRGGSQSVPTRYLLQNGAVTSNAISVGTHSGMGSQRLDSYGTFLQPAGVVDVRELNVDRLGVYQMSRGTLRVSRSFLLEGTLDLTNAAVPVTLAANTFGDFTAGTITAAHNATFYGGPGSLMSFKAGFDPFTEIGSIQTQGLIHVAGQSLAIPANKSVGGSGTIQGDVTNNGTVAPGNSPGELIVAGDYTQANSGVLAMELAGAAAGDADSLGVQGNATIDGLLDLALLDDFVPQPSDSFTILTAASISGVFDNAIGTVDFSGGRFDVSYSSNAVTLSNFEAVPEPAGLAMVASSCIGAALHRRRRVVPIG